MAGSEDSALPIVLYHYSASPYARRIVWYLRLRQIPYSECRQPPVMPRLDLSSKLGINYRRIPVLSVGKDVYCDTRIILEKLETLFPTDPLSAQTADHLAIQHLISRWVTDGGVFPRSSQLIPSNLPWLSDPKFTKDREQLTGRKWDKATIERNRPEALVFIRDAFRFLEEGLLSDNRNWVFGGEQASLGDIEAAWCFDWLTTMPGALPEEIISAQHFPKVYAWLIRLRGAVKDAGATSQKPPALGGEEAASLILNAAYAESISKVDETDPIGLGVNSKVEAWPVDSGFSHRDVGNLIGLDGKEVVLVLPNGIHLHFPRTGFRFRQVQKGPHL